MLGFLVGAVTGALVLPPVVNLEEPLREPYTFGRILTGVLLGSAVGSFVDARFAAKQAQALTQLPPPGA